MNKELEIIEALEWVLVDLGKSNAFMIRSKLLDKPEIKDAFDSNNKAYCDIFNLKESLLSEAAKEAQS